MSRREGVHGSGEGKPKRLGGDDPKEIGPQAFEEGGEIDGVI